MKEYSIKEIEKFTGIKAHTLRIWEQRYGLFTPKRSATNIRSYTDEDVKKALNINLLYSNGWKISKIANLSEKELQQEIKKIIESDVSTDDQHIELLIKSVLEFNEDKILKRLETIFVEKGLISSYVEIFVPLLVKIGNLWQVGAISVAQEHFFSNILRKFILLKTNELGLVKSKSNKKIVLFLHENEAHELGLLMTQYFLKQEGVTCYYLGAKVPIGELKKCVQTVQPDFIFTSFISRIEKEEVRKIINEIATFFDLQNLIVSGFQVDSNKNFFPEKVFKAKKISDITSFV